MSKKIDLEKVVKQATVSKREDGLYDVDLRPLHNHVHTVTAKSEAEASKVALKELEKSRELEEEAGAVFTLAPPEAKLEEETKD